MGLTSPLATVRTGKEGTQMLDRLRRARRFLEEAEVRQAAVPDRAGPSLAREAVIAAWDPETETFWPDLNFVIAAALLVELVREGRLEVSGADKKLQVTLRDSTPLGDPELDDALQRIGSGMVGQKVTTIRRFLPEDYEIVMRLVADGAVLEESRRKLGMFPVRRYRPTASAGRDELVARLRSSLLGESMPDERTALLISVLNLGVHPKLFVPRSSVKEARRRAEEILERIGDVDRALVSTLRVVWLNSDSGYSSSV